MLCTKEKIVKSVSAQITSKWCEDSISQPIKWEIFSVLPNAFPLLMGHFMLMHHSMSYIPPWVIPKSQEADVALHTLGNLLWSYNARKLFCSTYNRYIFFQEILVCIFLTRFATWELSFSFGIASWKDWKQKSSRQEVTHKNGNWTECYNWSAGLNHKRRLVVAQQTPQTVADAFNAITHAWDWKYKLKNCVCMCVCRGG